MTDATEKGNVAVPEIITWSVDVSVTNGPSVSESATLTVDNDATVTILVARDAS
jgi:hypothetical protein